MAGAHTAHKGLLCPSPPQKSDQESLPPTPDSYGTPHCYLPGSQTMSLARFLCRWPTAGKCGALLTGAAVISRSSKVNGVWIHREASPMECDPVHTHSRMRPVKRTLTGTWMQTGTSREVGYGAEGQGRKTRSARLFEDTLPVPPAAHTSPLAASSISREARGAPLSKSGFTQRQQTTTSFVKTIMFYLTQTFVCSSWLSQATLWPSSVHITGDTRAPRSGGADQTRWREAGRGAGAERLPAASAAQALASHAGRLSPLARDRGCRLHVSEPCILHSSANCLFMAFVRFSAGLVFSTTGGGHLRGRKAARVCQHSLFTSFRPGVPAPLNRHCSFKPPMTSRWGWRHMKLSCPHLSLALSSIQRGRPAEPPYWNILFAQLVGRCTPVFSFSRWRLLSRLRWSPASFLFFTPLPRRPPRGSDVATACLSHPPADHIGRGVSSHLFYSCCCPSNWNKAQEEVFFLKFCWKNEAISVVFKVLL